MTAASTSCTAAWVPASKAAAEVELVFDPFIVLGNMADRTESVIEVDGRRIDLRNRPLAALLAWLLPGGGHFYQRRHAKGTLYLICILTLWIVGFSIGGIHVVYASRHAGDHRWHYYLQIGAGAVALPALVQTRRINQYTSPRTGVTSDDYEPLWGGFMAPPHRPVSEEKTDQVSAWYARHGAGYEMGTWYTMIAGLLNILVIYDAYAGPLGIPISGRKRKDEDDTPAAADRAAKTSTQAKT